jgi:hypothetical protein
MGDFTLVVYRGEINGLVWAIDDESLNVRISGLTHYLYIYSRGAKAFSPLHLGWDKKRKRKSRYYFLRKNYG